MSTIAITEFINNPSGLSDADGEWLELFNYGSDPIDLNGWALSDEDSDSFTIATSELVIPAGGYLVLAKNKVAFEGEWLGGASDDRVVEWGGSMFLANGGDELILKDASDAVVWSLAYANDESAGRSTFLEYDTDFSVNTWGSKAAPGISRNGTDSASGTLGYEENDSTTDTEAFPSVGGDTASPLAGNYVAQGGGSGAASELFFSEYVEGSSLNKAVEIANFTGADIDLSGYSLEFYFNGNTNAGTTIDLSGNTVADGDVFVIADDGANAAILAEADLTPGNSFFNGDDAVVLRKDGAIVDVIGQIGDDPGSRWGSGNTSTQNSTIRRKSSVTAGDTDGSDAFDPSAEWDGFANNTFDGLGRHAVDGVEPPSDDPPSDDPPAVDITKIHAIQGAGITNLLDGQSVTIEAIVVGDFQDGDTDDSRNLRGFYVQEEDGDADADALTSEGIFVFENGDFITDVNLGDKVRVTGTVDEFFGETQIDTITSIEVITSDSSLPTAATISLPAAATSQAQDGDLQPDLEAFEGMRVSFADELTITEMFQLDRFNEIKLSQGGRLEQFTQNNAPSVAGYQAHLEDIGSRTIVYDDGLSQQNASISNLDGFQGFNTANAPSMGDTIANLQGVLTYQWAGASASQATWRVRSAEDGTNAFADTNPREAAPDDVGGRLTVASLNVLNYFTTLDAPDATTANGSDPRGADDLSRFGVEPATAEFDRQTEKLVTAIRAIDADVLGLVEIENDFQAGSSGNAIEFLVGKLNEAEGAIVYGWVDPGQPFVDVSDAISVGAIYKVDSVSVAANTAPAILSDATLPGDFAGENLFDGPSTNRASLAVTFTESATDEEFTIAVNHFKSKGSVFPDGNNASIGDGAGNNNPLRTRAAEALDAWLQTSPTGSADEDYLILGDLNAYAKETPITTLEDAGYTDLAREFVGDDAYSFVFDGQTGTLDYAMANGSLLSQVTGATEWHINSDEADALDYNLDFGRDASMFDGTSPARNSDHDPIILGLDLLTETPGEVIEGTRRRDNLTGTEGDDTITGFQGRDSLTGGAGDDTFVYTSITDAGDTITDFEAGSDVIDIAAVLDGFGYTGFDPIADGVVGFRDRRGDAFVTFDPDGSAGRARARTFLRVSGVSSSVLSDPANFDFGESLF